MGAIFQTTFLNTFLLNETVQISIKMSLEYSFSNGSINNIPALVQIMAWRRSGC